MPGADSESKRQADEVDSRYWLQKVIAAALKIGISKKELFEDYYFDEICIVFSEYYRRGEEAESEPEIEEVGADEFFGV